MHENLLSLSIQPFLNALNDDSVTTRSPLSDDLEQFFIQELPPSAIIVVYFRSMFHTENLKLRGLVFITIKVYKMPPSCPPLYPSHILTALPSGELISVYHYFQ